MDENNIGVDASQQEEFENNITLLQDFATLYGRLPVPEDDQQLYNWMRTQLEKRRISYTPRKNQIRLTSAGESWIRKEEAWFSKLQLVKDFIDQNGLLPTEETSFALAKWLKAQLTALETGMNLPPDKKKFLLELKQNITSANLVIFENESSFIKSSLPAAGSQPGPGIDDEAETPASKEENTPGYKEDRLSINKLWLHMLIRLVIFKEQNERWPQQKAETYEEERLYVWSQRMKVKHGEGTLSDSRTSYLSGIRFPFSDLEE